MGWFYFTGKSLRLLFIIYGKCHRELTGLHKQIIETNIGNILVPVILDIFCN